MPPLEVSREETIVFFKGLIVLLLWHHLSSGIGIANRRRWIMTALFFSLVCI